MQFKLYSIKNDQLELDITNVRPALKICEIEVDGHCEPWHFFWKPLQIRQFNEDFETVKNKVISYYKAETASCTENGVVTKKPGHLELTTAQEEWRLDNCKIVGCDIDEVSKSIVLELWYDGVSYKSFQKNENITLAH